MSNQNPANDKLEVPSDFRPMNSATLRLEVPSKDGFHRHWFRSDPNRIKRALQAGYRYVDPSEVNINNFDLGGDAKESGNSDLGTRVSVPSGDDLDSSGQPGRLYLMECPNHLYELNAKELEDRNASVAEALRGGKIGEDGQPLRDLSTKTRKVSADLFTPNKTRRP